MFTDKTNNMTEEQEKRRIALSSVYAAIFLTSFKVVVGFSTGSLGILSEAMHSGLDLIAAFITFIAVKIADRPADHDHHYGHGKIENFSALIETILLLITCAWIVYEAVKRIFYHTVEIEVTYWSYTVVITSIIVDISRSRALMRVAKKYNSQALEADALHFSTDIFSSGVVLIGLIGAQLSFHLADPIAALVVAVIVVWVSIRLGVRSINDLTDKAPEGIRETVEKVIGEMNEVMYVHDIKSRNSGSHIFIDLNIHVDPAMSIGKAHEIAHKAEDLIRAKIERSVIHIHMEPDEDHHY